MNETMKIAANALLGTRGAELLSELNKLLEEAEARGFRRGFESGYNAFDAEWMPEVPEEDLREPMVNAHVEGAPFTDMSEFHVERVAENRSPQPIEDEEFYEGIGDHYLAMQART